MRWLADHWYIPLGVLLIGILWGIFRRRENPARWVRTELAAIDAQTEARKLKAQLGTEAAASVLEDQYRAELDALDAAQAAQAKELRHDPEKLAKFLVRAGR